MPHIPSRARSVLALALVVNLLVAGSPAAALGLQPAPVAAASSVTVAVAASGFGVAAGLGRTAQLAVVDAVRLGVAFRSVPARTPTSGTAWVGRVGSTTPRPKAKAVSTADAPAGGSAAGTTFRGRNHLWIPSLGVDRSVSFFSCTSNAYPANRVYRWGCAGSNNIYLFGHAHSVFKSLHDAYVRGRLAKGMKVYYADASSRVTTYAVSWWKVTTPDKGAWAYAGQARLSLSLQTCVGAKSQYRLIVRLTKVD